MSEMLNAALLAPAQTLQIQSIYLAGLARMTSFKKHYKRLYSHMKTIHGNSSNSMNLQG